MSGVAKTLRIGLKEMHSQNSIFVSGMQWYTSKKDVKQHFEQFGRIQTLTMLMNKYRGVSKGKCFIKFKDASVIEDVLKASHHVIDERNVTIAIANANKKQIDSDETSHMNQT